LRLLIYDSFKDSHHRSPGPSAPRPDASSGRPLPRHPAARCRCQV